MNIFDLVFCVVMYYKQGKEKRRKHFVIHLLCFGEEGKHRGNKLIIIITHSLLLNLNFKKRVGEGNYNFFRNRKDRKYKN